MYFPPASPERFGSERFNPGAVRRNVLSQIGIIHRLEIPGAFRRGFHNIGMNIDVMDKLIQIVTIVIPRMASLSHLKAYVYNSLFLVDHKLTAFLDQTKRCCTTS